MLLASDVKGGRPLTEMVGDVIGITLAVSQVGVPEPMFEGQTPNLRIAVRRYENGAWVSEGESILFWEGIKAKVRSVGGQEIGGRLGKFQNDKGFEEYGLLDGEGVADALAKA